MAEGLGDARMARSANVRTIFRIGYLVREKGAPRGVLPIRRELARIGVRFKEPARGWSIYASRRLGSVRLVGRRVPVSALRRPSELAARCHCLSLFVLLSFLQANRRCRVAGACGRNV